MAARTQAWAKVKFANGADEYLAVGNNKANYTLGAGRAGDYVDVLTLVVTNASNAAVSLKDGAGASIPVFPSAPGSGIGTYTVPLGMSAVNNWNITAAVGVDVLVTGLFKS